EVAQHHEVIPERFQLLHGLHHLVAFAVRLGKPVLLNDSVRDIDDRQPDWRNSLSSEDPGRYHGIEQRKCDCSADAAQHGPAAKGFLWDHHKSELLLNWN